MSSISFRNLVRTRRAVRGVIAFAVLALVALPFVAWGGATPLGEQDPPLRKLEPAPAPVQPAQAISGPEDLSSGDPCRTSFDPQQFQASQTDPSPTRLVLDAVVIAQLDDQRCGPREPEAIICRALWLLQVLDPVALGLDSLIDDGERNEAASALQWALTEAIESPGMAQDPLGQALAQLRAISRSLTSGMQEIDQSQDEVARLVTARAHPDILEPLSVMQDRCLQIP